ncbi:MAG TPA: TlpA disulfide reductase family protein [Burkholderiales bacterium]|nr:TlpA disulfide reductase family protein [Burkholderiales bacterium]
MKLRTAIAFATVAVVAAGAGVFVSLHKADSKLPFSRSVAPKPAPPLQFEDGAGRPRTLADFRGRVVLLNIWATWCAPCREEMPALDRLQAQLGGPGFEVLAVSVDQQGPEVARRFFADVGIKSLAFYIDRSAKAAFQANVAGLPATLLIDAEGREIGRHLGAAQWDSPQVIESLRGYTKRP